MTTEEILRYNKRCADLLGLKISIKPEDGYDYGTWYKPCDIEDEVIPSPVLYHSDWNWIMEVVEAIEKLKDEQFYTWRVDIYLESCQIMNSHNFEGNLIHNQTSKKEATVQAINQFLIWYEKSISNS
jgi:hypothetical protein